ncbi:MAG: nicotinate-nucleotide adenylyltransferase [Chloroflexi bacterium]|nr:nicotinate-nucleotide adenylyltransferase [Chloroflexota bacterium]
MNSWPHLGSESATRIHRGCRLGVFGGTFDPVHIGYLIVAEEAYAHLSLDWVLFVPAHISPLKQGEGTFFTAAERWQMVELAIADNPHFAASRIELDREGPSYTIDTLRTLRSLLAPSALYFIMGADALHSLRAWRQPEEILKLARLVAISRPGHTPDLEALDRDIPGLAEATHIIETLMIGISSTDIRRRLRCGLPIKYQVPASVEAFIYGCHSMRKLGLPARRPGLCV